MPYNNIQKTPRGLGNFRYALINSFLWLTYIELLKVSFIIVLRFYVENVSHINNYTAQALL